MYLGLILCVWVFWVWVLLFYCVVFDVVCLSGCVGICGLSYVLVCFVVLVFYCLFVCYCIAFDCVCVLCFGFVYNCCRLLLFLFIWFGLWRFTCVFWIVYCGVVYCWSVLLCCFICSLRWVSFGCVLFCIAFVFL